MTDDSRVWQTGSEQEMCRFQNERPYWLIEVIYDRGAPTDLQYKYRVKPQDAGGDDDWYPPGRVIETVYEPDRPADRQYGFWETRPE